MRGILVSCILLLILILIVSTGFAVEPVKLGRGVDHSAINLERGAAYTGQKPVFGSSGFVPPQTSQPKILDPGVLVYQAERLVDEARYLRDEAAALRNETALLYEQTTIIAQDVVSAEQNVSILEQDARESANISSLNAMLAASYMNETASLRSQTEIFARDVETAAQNVSVLEKQAEESANISSQNAILAATYMNETASLCNQTTIIAGDVGTLVQNISALEKKFGGSGDIYSRNAISDPYYVDKTSSMREQTTAIIVSDVEAEMQKIPPLIENDREYANVSSDGSPAVNASKSVAYPANDQNWLIAEGAEEIEDPKISEQWGDAIDSRPKISAKKPLHNVLHIAAYIDDKESQYSTSLYFLPWTLDALCKR